MGENGLVIISTFQFDSSIVGNNKIFNILQIYGITYQKNNIVEYIIK